MVQTCCTTRQGKPVIACNIDVLLVHGSAAALAYAQTVVIPGWLHLVWGSSPHRLRVGWVVAACNMAQQQRCSWWLVHVALVL